MEDLKLIVAPSPPHLRDTDTTEKIMSAVLISLLPVLAASIYFFRWDAARLVLLSAGAAVATEAIFQKNTQETHYNRGGWQCFNNRCAFGINCAAQLAQLDGDCGSGRGHRHW